MFAPIKAGIGNMILTTDMSCVLQQHCGVTWSWLIWLCVVLRVFIVVKSDSPFVLVAVDAKPARMRSITCYGIVISSVRLVFYCFEGVRPGLFGFMDLYICPFGVLAQGMLLSLLQSGWSPLR